MFGMGIFWIAALVLIVWGFKSVFSGKLWGDRHEEALEVLRLRYARGEIDREEFEARRRGIAH